MPITEPCESSSGPPLLPGLMATRGQRAIEAERVSDGDHFLADLQILRIAQPEKRQLALWSDLEKRQVVVVVGAENARLVLGLVGERHLDLRGAAGNHMPVGENPALLVNQKSGALPPFRIDLLKPVFPVHDAGDIHRGAVRHAVHIDIVLLVRSERGGRGPGHFRRRPQSPGGPEGLNDPAHAPIRIRGEIDEARGQNECPENEA